MTPKTNANFRAFPALLQGSREFDEPRGFVASAPNLREPVVALSLGGQRRRIEIALLPDDVRGVLQLDGHAAAHPELVIAVMDARRATGQRRGWASPSSEWPRLCWLATTNKCLARNNKTPNGDTATNRQHNKRRCADEEVAARCRCRRLGTQHAGRLAAD
jgi:hypothetical protein